MSNKNRSISGLLDIICYFAAEIYSMYHLDIFEISIVFRMKQSVQFDAITTFIFLTYLSSQISR